MATCTICARERGFLGLVTWKKCSRYGCGKQYCRQCFRRLPQHAFNVPLCEGGHGFSVPVCAVCGRDGPPGSQMHESCLTCGRTYCEECYEQLPKHNSDAWLFEGKECEGGHKFKVPDRGND